MTRSRKRRQPQSQSQSPGRTGSGSVGSRSSVAGVAYGHDPRPAVHTTGYSGQPSRSYAAAGRRSAYEPEEPEYEEQAYQDQDDEEQEYAEEEYEEQAAYYDAYEMASEFEDPDAYGYEYGVEERYDQWAHRSRANDPQARSQARRSARPQAEERFTPRRPGPRSVAPARRDLFPIVMGSVISMLFIGLIVVGYLLLSGAPGTPTGAVLSGSTNGATGAGNALGQGPPQAAPQSLAGQAPAASGTEPVRMPLADFKALYEGDAARRPLIVDARPKDKYDEGHIKGAVSIPLAEVDGRLAEVPKDKLVVAYCQ